jgi:hypothetical protein
VALAVLSPLLSGSSGFVPAGFIRQHPRPKNAPLLDLTQHEPTSIDAGIISTIEEKNSKKSSWSMPERYAIKTSIRALSTSERLTWSISPKTSIDAIEHMQFDEQSPAFFIVGYGATRRVESSSRVDESARTKSRARRYERVASLFEDHVTLMPLSYWLPAFAEQNKGRYTQVINLINDLLPAKCKIQKTATQTQYGREHLFEINGIALPFGALSDGFRAYIGWIGDMLFHVCQGVASGLKLREMRGIVMVDEIDLAKALPNVQFILTTHSPLVVGSLMSQNLFVLAEENGSTIVKRLPEHVRGKSAEQILLSPYFGLESTRATPTATALSKLARSAVSGNTKASVDYLRILAEGMSFEEMAEPEKPTVTAARRAPKKPSRPAE